ncbi:MAG: galactokinase, partial [Bacteroidota bacterium]
AATTGQDWDIIVRSPGRINIIGEHMDYNGGLVLPAAIDKAIFFAARKNNSTTLSLQALDLNESVEQALPQDTATGQIWVDYLLGIADQFRQRGFEVPGLDIVFGSNLARGAGVSSSAALEGGMAYLVNELIGAGLSRLELARICNQSSNHFMGIPSGIMDQFASLNGVKDRALLLNCDTLEFDLIKAELPGYDFLLVNSHVTHQLVDSGYTTRVHETREGLAALQDLFPELTSLGQVTVEMVEQIKDKVSPVIFRRCAYVAQESQRIQRAVQALERADPIALGKEMNDTHAGLRDDYEVSVPEVDFLQDFAQNYPGVAGSRIMGGGFGGCTINLLQLDVMEDFKVAIREAYSTALGIEP